MGKVTNSPYFVRTKALFAKLHVSGSIIEPVVAVVILVVTMSMAFAILARTNITPKIQAKNKANEIISQEYFTTITEDDYLDKEEKIGAFTLEKKIELQKEKNLIFITLIVFDSKQSKIEEQVFVESISNAIDDSE